MAEKTNEELNAYYESIANEVRDELMQIPGVKKVSFGLKQKGVDTLDEFCIRVYVEKKKSEPDLQPNAIVPKEIRGVKTDVIEVPTPVPLENMNKYRPLKGGIAISNGVGGIGTLGGIASANSACKIVVLSNFHVLYADLPDRNSGHPIYQPDKDDDIEDKNKIGTTTGKYAFGGKTDCATAHIGCKCWCCRCGTSYDNVIHNPLNATSPISIKGIRPNPVRAREIVYKVGYKTEHTVGQVIDADVEFDFTAESMHGTSLPGVVLPVHFTNQIHIQWYDEPTRQVQTQFTFSQRGDSGSLIVDKEGFVVGLLFAGDQDFQPYNTYANHIAAVVEALDITINTSPRGSSHSSGDTIQLNTSTLVPEMQGYVNEKENELSKTAEGRELIKTITRHKDEVFSLVNHNRAVTICWHRNSGPAFVAHLVNSYNREDYLIPSTIKGNTIKSLLQEMATVLGAHGSTELQQDIERYYSLVESMEDSYSSLKELLSLAETAIYE